MSYIRENFLLTNKTAERLYFAYAKDMPIFDYHCHLPEKQILENKPFNDVFEIWLAGDHYKWRLMRNYGVNEEFITGKTTSNKEKFLTYCRVLGTAFGNPLYHWSQVELKEFFNCEIEINEENAELIWDWCNDYIRLNGITPQKLIEQSNVTHLFTTNEIFDDLSTFPAIAEKGYKFKVIPAFRADKIMNIEAAQYNEFIEKLGTVSALNDDDRLQPQSKNEYGDYDVDRLFPERRGKRENSVWSRMVVLGQQSRHGKAFGRPDGDWTYRRVCRHADG